MRYSPPLKLKPFEFLAISNRKVEKILKGSLDSILSPSVKIQIIGGKVCLRCKGKILLGVVNKLLKTTPSNVLLFHFKQTFLPIIWIFTEGDRIGSRLPFNIFSTLYTLVSLIEIVAAWLIFWVDIKISIQKVNYTIFYSSVWISASYWSK